MASLAFDGHSLACAPWVHVQMVDLQHLPLWGGFAINALYLLAICIDPVEEDFATSSTSCSFNGALRSDVF